MTKPQLPARCLALHVAIAGAEVGAPPHIIVVQNWLEELRRLVPTN